MDGCKGKPSTNGTWLYINEDMKIFPNPTDEFLHLQAYKVTNCQYSLSK